MGNIKNYILANGGCTLDCELNLYSGAGYVVSREGYEFTSSNIDEIVNKIDEYKATARELEAYIGVWYNTEDGLYYLDINNIYADKKEAIFYGLKFKQLAIFDIANGQEIRMDNLSYADYNAM